MTLHCFSPFTVNSCCPIPRGKQGLRNHCLHLYLHFSTYPYHSQTYRQLDTIQNSYVLIVRCELCSEGREKTTTWPEASNCASRAEQNCWEGIFLGEGVCVFVCRCVCACLHVCLFTVCKCALLFHSMNQCLSSKYTLLQVALSKGPEIKHHLLKPVQWRIMLEIIQEICSKFMKNGLWFHYNPGEKCMCLCTNRHSLICSGSIEMALQRKDTLLLFLKTSSVPIYHTFCASVILVQKLSYLSLHISCMDDCIILPFVWNVRIHYLYTVHLFCSGVDMLVHS